MRVGWRQQGPHSRLNIEYVHLILPRAILKATEDDNSVAIKDSRVLIDANWERVRLSFACHGRHFIPIEGLQVEAVHLRTVVVSACQCAPDQVHVLSDHDALMMGDLTGERVMSLHLLPGEYIILCRTVLQVADFNEIEAPQVVQCAFSDVAATEDVHLFLVDERSMVTATLRLGPSRPELVPVTLFKGLAIGLHGAHVETLGHVDRFLFLKGG